MTDAIFNFIVKSVRDEEQRKNEEKDSTRAISPCSFFVERKAIELVLPSTTKGIHHRTREKHYTTKLEEAEKELKEKGISIEAFDANTGTYLNAANISSGHLQGTQQNFQPRVDQRLADAVKNAKNSMVEHRGKAEQYEKYAAAFALAPDKLIRLGIEDVYYFGLGNKEK